MTCQLKLSREHLRALQETVKQSTTATSERVSQTHAKKFNQLLSSMKRGRSPPVVDKEKWVVNLLRTFLRTVKSPRRSTYRKRRRQRYLTCERLTNNFTGKTSVRKDLSKSKYVPFLIKLIRDQESILTQSQNLTN